MQRQIIDSGSVEWYTPPEVCAAVQAFFGKIDLDPCANPEKTVPAGRHLIENGLAETWRGRVYVNPPYRHVQQWVEKALSDPIDEVILLVAARTDAKWFHPCLQHSVCFVRGRLKFWHPGKPLRHAVFPSVFVYRGPRPAEFAEHFAKWGTVLQGKPSYPAGQVYQLPLEVA